MRPAQGIVVMAEKPVLVDIDPNQNGLNPVAD